MKNLTHPKETFYFALNIIISLLISVFILHYLMKSFSISLETFILWSYLSDYTKIEIIMLFLKIALTMFFFIISRILLQGYYIGKIKNNGILINEEQFPEIYRILIEQCEKLNIGNVPNLYVVEHPQLNAMATRFLGKNYVILMNETLELAYSEGKEVLEFIIAHELGHIKNKHFLKSSIIFPSIISFLTYRAFLRACELTCDNYGKMLSPEGAEKGIIALAVGKNLFKKVDIKTALKNGIVDQGFWGWLAEKMSTHPSFQQRLQNLK